MSRGSWLWLGAAGAALAACATEPASIEVKLPKEAAQSAAAGGDMPAFRRAGDTLELRASGYDADHVYTGPPKVRWASSDPQVAVVDDAGHVTIAGSGQADIIASGDGYAKPLEGRFKVRARIVNAVSIVTPAGFKGVGVSQEAQLTAEVKDERGQPITDALVRWSCNDHGVWVDDRGKVSGAATGETTVTAAAEGRSASITFEVTDH